MNTLDEVLESCGWVKDEKSGWVPPDISEKTK